VKNRSQVEIPTKQIRLAQFEMWVPDILKDKVKKPKATIVCTSGSNSDGRGYTSDKKWQEFAEAERCALVGTFFMDKDPTGIEGYCKAHEESGECLLWAMRAFQKDLAIIGLEQAPLLLYGHSAGGQFNYEMNAAYPNRVGAFVVNKGGIYYSALVPELARYTPGLFILGKKDDQWRQDIIRGLVAVNRRGGAKTWALVQEECGHEENNSEDISRKFFKQVLTAYRDKD